MSLIQISDPESTETNLKKFVVGIDLGTTNSLIASRDNKVKFYTDKDSTMISSIVNFLPDNKVTVGKSNSTDVYSIASIKRIIGLTCDELKNTIKKLPFELDMSNEKLPLIKIGKNKFCLLYTSPSPRDATLSRMPSSA